MSEMKLFFSILAAAIFLQKGLAATVTVAWDPPADNATGWIVYEQFGTNWTQVFRAGTTNVVITNVLSGFHIYSVTATNAVGLESPRSPSASAIIFPGTPTNITIKLSAVFQYSPDVIGPWTDFSETKLPIITASQQQAFYRMRLDILP